MCNNCFTSEIRFFKDKEAWTSFDLELSRKISQGNIKHIKFIGDSWRDKDDGEDVFECVQCKQGWRLRNYYQDGDGYFLQFSVVGKTVARLTGRRKLILRLVTVLLLIVINIIYWVWTH